MSLGRIYNEDSFEALRDIANECERPVIVTDPPFNIGYHYGRYRDRVDDGEYFASLAEMFSEYPSVVVHYPEALHRLSMEMGAAPIRVVSWVYPSNTRRQHRDIAFWGVEPDFTLVRRPYRNPNDKRVKELQKRTGGGSIVRLGGVQSGEERVEGKDGAPVPNAARADDGHSWVARQRGRGHHHRPVRWQRYDRRGVREARRAVACY